MIAELAPSTLPFHPPFPSMSIPSPRPPESSKSSTSSHARRPSLPLSPALSPRAAPVPVPQRHGSLVSRKRPSIDAGSFGSVFLSSSLPSSVILPPLARDGSWLDTKVGQLLDVDVACPIVSHMKGSEEAVEVGPIMTLSDTRYSSRVARRVYWCKRRTPMAFST